MSARRTSDALAEAGEAGRWGRALAIVLGLHALPLLIAAWWLGPPLAVPSQQPAILIDMTASADRPAPAADPVEDTQPEAEATPADTRPRREAEPATRPVVSLPDPAVALPARPSAPAAVPVRQPAPQPRPASPPSRAATGRPTWEGLVLGHLDRHKRYPRAAQLRRQQGVPWIRIVIDRDGAVLSSRLERSSGFRALDSEAVALPRRAAPLPKPPEEIAGEAIELVIPVEFFLG